jgi:hypothetical protein
MAPPAAVLPWNAPARMCREYAIKQLLASPDVGRRDQILHMLSERPRAAVGHFAVNCVQTQNLGLRPWIEPPVSWVDDGRLDAPGDRQMKALIAKMRELRISLLHADPVAAIGAAEAAARSASA